jgi:hypothetical protein
MQWQERAISRPSRRLKTENVFIYSGSVAFSVRGEDARGRPTELAVDRSASLLNFAIYLPPFLEGSSAVGCSLTIRTVYTHRRMSSRRARRAPARCAVVDSFNESACMYTGHISPRGALQRRDGGQCSGPRMDQRPPTVSQTPCKQTVETLRCFPFGNHVGISGLRHRCRAARRQPGVA